MILAVATSTVDLSPILDPLIQIGGLLLTGIAGWLSLRFAQYLHLSKQSAALTTILGAVDRGIAYGTQVAQAKVDANDKVAVSNATQAEAVNYVVSKLPGTLKAIDIDPTTADGRQKVADMVLAKLPPS